MATEDGRRSRSHGLSTEWLKMQAQAIGVPLVQGQTDWDGYESEFKKVLDDFKGRGVTAGVFGDIDFEEHREWVERVCTECGINAYLPLWGEHQDSVLGEFIDAGFKAVVIATKADLLGKEWLGQEIDLDFVTDLSRQKNVTPCGEAGEYHTFVTDGPLFAKRIRILEAEAVSRDGHWYFDIRKCELIHK
jgi:diphthine-ammonia ligase